MHSIPLEVIIVVAVFVGVVWFITRDSEPKYPPISEDFSHRREKYTININIALNAKPLLSNSKGLFPEGESIFSSFVVFNESRNSNKEGEETGGQKGGD